MPCTRTPLRPYNVPWSGVPANALKMVGHERDLDGSTLIDNAVNQCLWKLGDGGEQPEVSGLGDNTGMGCSTCRMH